MRNTPNVKAERCRVAGHGQGNNGFFIVPCCDHMLRVQVSDGMGWDHVSVSLPYRCPTWEEMEFIANLFFRDDETAMQLHVPASEHLSYHPYCLHWWRPQSRDEARERMDYWERSGEPMPSFDLPGPIPRPPAFMVAPEAEHGN